MQWRLLCKRTLARLERRESLAEAANARFIETGADMTCELELIAVPVAEQQRTERVSRSLTLGVSAYDELRASHRLDLLPRGGAAPGLIGAVLALRHDALEPAIERRRVHGLGVVRRMDELEMRSGQQALRQVAVPIDIRVLPQVDTGEVEQVEAHEHHR